MKIYPLARNLKASEQPAIYTVKSIIDTVVSDGNTCKVRVNFERAKLPEGAATDNSKKPAGVIITTNQALIKAVYDKDGKSCPDATAKIDIAKNAAKLIKDGVFILEYENIVGDGTLNFVVQAVDEKDKPMEDQEQQFAVKIVEKEQAKTPKGSTATKTTNQPNAPEQAKTPKGSTANKPTNQPNAPGSS